uniref:Uncharacterized protein n=1 Tax=Anopheles dirus TaxID=7168 RepID=A0A182N6R2_9DIPT
MHHGSGPRFGPPSAPVEGRKSDSDSDAGCCRSWSRQWVLHLTLVALFLTSYGYDPYLREQELEQATAADAEDDDGVLPNVLSSYHDPELEDPEEEAIDIHYHVLLYLPRVLVVIVIVALHRANVSVATLQRIVHFGHPVVALLYALLRVPSYLSYELRFIGCLSEVFWSAKVYLYVYQLAVFSPAGERLHYLIAGTLALSIGSASHPFVAEIGASYPILSQYMLNLAISLLHMGIFQPIMLCGSCGTREIASNPTNHHKHRLMNVFIAGILIAVVAVNTVVLQWFLTDNATLLRPFLPFLSSDDLFGVFWQLFYVAVAFSTLGFLLIYLRTADLMVATFTGQLLAGVLYLYLEEPIAARICLVMNSFVFATGLEQLLTLCDSATGQVVTVMGLTFACVHLQPYAYFGLLLALWSSPDICIVVLLAFNAFFALTLVVVRKWLNCEPVAHEQPSVPKTFATQITTIS